MAVCVVSSCKNYYRFTKVKDLGIQYFRFPKDEDMVKKWENACRRKEKINLKNARICSIHFEASDFEITMKKRLSGYPLNGCRHLKADAVPTLNLVEDSSDITQKQKLETTALNIKEEVIIDESDLPKCDEQQLIPIIPKTESIADNILTINSNDEPKSVESTATVPPKSDGEQWFIDSSIFNDSEDSTAHIIKTLQLENAQLKNEHQKMYKVIQNLRYESRRKLEIKTNVISKYKKNIAILREELHKWKKGALKIEKSFPCDVCDKKFSRNYILTKHKLIHLGKKRYLCDVCGKGFLHTSELVAHKRIHTGEKPYSCDVCDKRFAQQTSLRVHKRTHSGDKTYRCNTCSQSFDTRDCLILHKRTHSGDKTYRCNTCSQSFDTRDCLILHKRTHSGEKDYLCDTCSKSFATRSCLTLHKRIHSGEKHYRCDTCSKSFTRKINLNLHKRIHSGEKPYSCNVCDQRFTQQGSLVRHKRIHSGEKPYECDICNKTFRQKAALDAHKSTHYKIK